MAGTYLLYDDIYTDGDEIRHVRMQSSWRLLETLIFYLQQIVFGLC